MPMRIVEYYWMINRTQSSSQPTFENKFEIQKLKIMGEKGTEVHVNKTDYKRNLDFLNDI